mmetsp:Transcript_26499/g.63991  ORF Transcript_26499/g.63991 Transcript_26499/m.63991 type:complete len:275 (+) Transcript_26499:221-1045(+)
MVLNYGTSRTSSYRRLLFPEKVHGRLSYSFRIFHKVSLRPRGHNHWYPAFEKKAEIFSENVLLLGTHTDCCWNWRARSVEGCRILSAWIRIRTSHQKCTFAPSFTLSRELLIYRDSIRCNICWVFKNVAQHCLFDGSFTALRGVHGISYRVGKLICRCDSSTQSINQIRDNRVVLLLHLYGCEWAAVCGVDQEQGPYTLRNLFDGIQHVERSVAGTDNIDRFPVLGRYVRQELLQESTKQLRLVRVEVLQSRIIEAVARKFGQNGGKASRPRFL